MALMDEKQEKIGAAAEHLYNQQIKSDKPDWATYYRRILGRHGLVYRAYPSMDDRSHFEKTDLYRRIQWMITELRKKTVPDEATQKDTKVITVRIPKALHEALADEARDYSTSVNKLCISKLLQFIDAERIPSPRREQAPEELSWMEETTFGHAEPAQAIAATDHAADAERDAKSHQHSHIAHKSHASHAAEADIGHVAHPVTHKHSMHAPVEGS